jgi:hypothetical protein
MGFIASAVRPTPEYQSVGSDASVRSRRRTEHQARIKAGNGRSWSLYAARFPSGTSTSRDYLTINVFDSMLEFDKYEESLVKVLPQVYPKKTAEQLISEAVATRDEALNELWIEIDRVDRE